jgi:hypothetical protein
VARRPGLWLTHCARKVHRLGNVLGTSSGLDSPTHTHPWEGGGGVGGKGKSEGGEARITKFAAGKFAAANSTAVKPPSLLQENRKVCCSVTYTHIGWIRNKCGRDKVTNLRQLGEVGPPSGGAVPILPEPTNHLLESLQRKPEAYEVASHDRSVPASDVQGRHAHKHT